jgi:hypothetical protein
MHELDRNARFDRAAPTVVAKLGGDLRNQRAIALSAGAEQVLSELGEKLVFGSRYLIKASLNGDDTFPDTGNRHEFSEDGSVH